MSSEESRDKLKYKSERVRNRQSSKTGSSFGLKTSPSSQHIKQKAIIRPVVAKTGPKNRHSYKSTSGFTAK